MSRSNSNLKGASPKRRTMARNSRKRGLILSAAISLVVALGVGGTFAYLAADSDPLTNTFTLPENNFEIQEDFDGAVKENVYVKNTGDVSSYVRAAVAITWRNSTGGILGDAPSISHGDYEIEYGSDWIEGADGFYYYPSVVPGGESTNPLIVSCEPLKPAPMDGYVLHVEVLASTIQADGGYYEGPTFVHAVEDAWRTDVNGLKVDEGSLDSSSDDTISVTPKS